MEDLRHVILVDDNDIVRELMRAMLEREGFVVATAASGYDALLIAQDADDVDLLVTDIYMPGMDGLELADRLLERHPEASVVYTSGHADERIIAPGAVPAGAAFLPKPFTMSELVRAAHDVFAASALLRADAVAA